MICEEYKWEQTPGTHKYKKVPTGRKVEILGYCTDDEGDNQPFAAAVIEDEQGFLTSCPLSLLKPLKLTADEIAFVKRLQIFGEGKHCAEPYYTEEGEALWENPEKQGYIKAIGSYKFKVLKPL